MSSSNSLLTPKQQRWVLKALVAAGVGMVLLGLMGLIFVRDAGQRTGDLLDVFQVILGLFVVVIGVRGLRRTPLR